MSNKHVSCSLILYADEQGVVKPSGPDLRYVPNPWVEAFIQWALNHSHHLGLVTARY